MKRPFSEITDRNDQNNMDAEHNKQIQEQIENLKKRPKIKNHTIPYITTIQLGKQMRKIMIDKVFNIAQYTTFKHDVFGIGMGKIFRNIWKFVGNIGLSRIAKVHAHYENEIDIAEYHYEKSQKEIKELWRRLLLLLR